MYCPDFAIYGFRVKEAAKTAAGADGATEAEPEEASDAS
jgi:hypothetical protein